jgi:hypothetical protein
VKLLAILRDSFREAIDTRVFSILVAFSAALMLFFASLTFTPRPAREVLEPLQVQLNLAPARREFAPLGVFFHLTDVEPVEGAPDGPDSPLRFTVRADFVDRKDAERARQAGGPVEDFLRDNFGRYRSARVLVVTNARPAPPGANATDRQAAFVVTTRPTAATRRFWRYDSSLLFGLLPLSGLWHILEGSPPVGGEQAAAPALGVQLLILEEMLISGFGSWGTVLVSVLVTSFFVPSMLHKGTLDLLLVKPLPRWRLLVYKYLGGLVFIALNATLAVAGIYLVLALRAGVWCHALLLLIPLLTFGFAILYSVSVLVSILTHSPIVSILITCLVWVLLWGVGWAHGYLHRERGGLPPTVLTTVDALHAVLPRTGDLNDLTGQLVAGDLSPELGDAPTPPARQAPHWGESLAVSSSFIVVLLGLACVRFSTRDY